MRNAWILPSTSHSTGKCNKTNCMGRIWEIDTRTFPILWVLFSYPVPILWYTSSYGNKSVHVMQHFQVVIRAFAALQIFFTIFLLKWGIKSTRFWNSSLNLEFSVFNVSFIFFSFFFFLEAQKYFFALFNFLQMVIFITLLRR